MRKILNTSLYYIMIGLALGVFYREFTKFNNFTEPTMLSSLHPHTILMGGLVPIILQLVANQKNTTIADFKKIWAGYNIGLIFTIFMMLVRGILEVRNIPLTSMVDSAISGFAGLGHIILGVCLVLLLIQLRNKFND